MLADEAASLREPDEDDPVCAEPRRAHQPERAVERRQRVVEPRLVQGSRLEEPPRVPGLPGGARQHVGDVVEPEPGDEVLEHVGRRLRAPVHDDGGATRGLERRAREHRLRCEMRVVVIVLQSV